MQKVDEQMIDKKEFLSQFDLTAEKYMYMIERKIVIDSRPPYINIQIVRASDVDDLHRLYEEIKLTHYIDEPIRDLPRFKMKGKQ
jgi:hypothetical protein